MSTLFTRRAFLASSAFVATAVPPLARGADRKPLDVVIRGGTITGRVTSIVRSPTLGKVIGLAYVAPDQAEPGSAFDIKTDSGQMRRATVVKLPFYDPDGARQEM